MTDQLFPREPRRMKQPRRMLQPRKDEIRLRLEIAQAQAALRDTPLWWRLWRRVWVRIVEVDRIEDVESHKQKARVIAASYRRRKPKPVWEESLCVN